MKQLITIVIVLCSIGAMAQIKQHTQAGMGHEKIDSSKIAKAVHYSPYDRTKYTIHLDTFNSYWVVYQEPIKAASKIKGTAFPLTKGDTYFGDTHYWITDNSQPIWTLQITSDTSRLHPIDTSYYTIANQLYREITYKFKDIKPKELLIRSYNTGHNNWTLFSFIIWDDDKK